MFKGLAAMDPFSFTFNDGVVRGPNYSFDLRAPLAADSSAGRDLASPAMLIHFVYEDWNKKFNASCIKAGGNLFLGVTWDTSCLSAAGTANLLTTAGLGILSQVEAWGRTYLGTAEPPTTTTPPTTTNPPSTQPPTTMQCATVGKSPIAGQSCCTGLVKDPFNVCNAPASIPGAPAVCVGTYICSIPDMWLYGGLGILALLMMKR